MAKGEAIIVQDRTHGVVDALRKLTKEQVLVGVPEDKASRDSGEITNAALAYIHNNGAPAANIPARPFLIPGVRKSKREVLPHLRAAALHALKGEADKAHRELVLAGIVAENYVKRELTTGEFVPLKPATIAARFRGRDTVRRRSSENKYLKFLQAGGISAAVAQAAAGIRALINTGQLLRSITSVVRRVK